MLKFDLSHAWNVTFSKSMKISKIPCLDIRYNILLTIFFWKAFHFETVDVGVAYKKTL